MRKPVCLAVVGICIVVAGASLGVDPYALPRPARVLPERHGAGGRVPRRARHVRDAAGGVDQPLRPQGRDEDGVQAPRDGRKIRFPGAAQRVRSRGDDRILLFRDAPGDPLGERDEGAEGVPRKGGDRARGDPRLRRARQGVDLARKGAGKTGDPARGKPRTGDGDRSLCRRFPSPPPPPCTPPDAAAPRPPPGGTQAVGAPDASSWDADEESPSSSAGPTRRLRGNPAVTGRAAVDELPGMRPICMFKSGLPGSGCESGCTSRYWGFPSSWRRLPSA